MNPYCVADQNCDVPGTEPYVRHSDPILDELWAIKMELNQAANFEMEKLVEQASAFDLETALRDINAQLTH